MQKRKINVIVVLMVMALASTIVVGCSSGSTTVSVAVAKTGTVTESVYASGTVEPNAQYSLYGPTGATVKQVYVKVGDKVKRGDVLVSFDDSDLKTQISLAQNQLKILQIQLDSYKNMKNSSGGVSSQISSGGMSIDDQISMQEIQIANQKLNIQSLQGKLNSYTLTSPADGVVGMLTVSAGVPYAMGQPAVVVYDVSKKKVSLSLNPVDAVSVKVGQDATIYFGDQTYTGSVSSVSPVSLNNAVAVELLIKDGELIPIGSSVDVEIIKDQKTGLTIPSSALIYGNGGKYYVKVVQNGVVKQKQINVGAQSSSSVLVTSGLKEGDQVLTDHLDLADGQKVVVQ
jgi:HlyD family secretion protein